MGVRAPLPVVGRLVRMLRRGPAGMGRGGVPLGGGAARAAGMAKRKMLPYGARFSGRFGADEVEDALGQEPIRPQ